jgi:hypothetical protein
MRKPLYAIAQEYIQAYNALFSDEELPEDAIRDTLDGIQDEFEAKALNIAALIKNMQADVNALKHAEDSINKRRKRLEKLIQNAANYLLINIQGAGLEDNPIESPEHYIKIKNCPISVQIDAIYTIPNGCWRTTIEPDKTLLRDFLEKCQRGEANPDEIKGVRLVRNKKLVIK